MAAAAQQVALQGVAAASIFPTQLQPAVLGENTAKRFWVRHGQTNLGT